MSFDQLLPLFREPHRALRNLESLVQRLSLCQTAAVIACLEQTLPHLADPDMAVNNLERLLGLPAMRERLPALLADDANRLKQTAQLLATSQFFADTLLQYPDALDTLTEPRRRYPSTQELLQALQTDVDAAHDDLGILRAFRRFRQLQLLRIGVNDILRDRPLEEITRELSRVADACIEVALQTALRNVSNKYGTALSNSGQPVGIVALAFGKLGGEELNYSSDIDLMFVYDQDGRTTGRRSPAITNQQFFARVVTEVVRLLSSHTDRGVAYRIDLRLRPEGQRGPLARSLAATLSYYDVMGRTWERQALIKLRPCAGDLELGRVFIQAIEPFIYRKYFSFSEINEVKALKRQMEQRSIQAGIDERDVKTGRGGIRDIEYTVQFLQLLNGGDLPAVRQRNTLLALDALEIAGCLTSQETYTLADAYRFLRKTEHRLQLLFDWQTHKLPTRTEELAKLARRMGYHPGRAVRTALRMPSAPGIPSAASTAQKRSPLDESPRLELTSRPLLIDPLDRFLQDYYEKTRLDRAILDHLLHMTFTQSDDRSEPESDLILIPDPDDGMIRRILGQYPFKNVLAVYQNLSSLAREAVPFLSHRRCRHFLASIAPQLLRAVAETPDPDQTLNHLDRVTSSLGAKAVLYELFSYNPASLKLYVDICACSSYLTTILTTNPGMIDELLDSLILDQPRTREELESELAELLRGASDPEPILHSFQDKELLRISVRDLLGRDSVRETTRALSDLADTILNAVFHHVEAGPAADLSDELRNQPAGRYVVLGLGKLGGREISYHSDLDLIVIYESSCGGPSVTSQASPGDSGSLRNAAAQARYFTQLTQQVIKWMARSGPLGRLYEVDMRLRPTGKSGSLAISLAEFERYFSPGGGGDLWERQCLTRARIVRGDPNFAQQVLRVVHSAIHAVHDIADLPGQVWRMREKLEASAKSRSLKRGPGGIMDIEFLVQFLQMKYAHKYPELLQPNLWDALEALARVQLLSRDTAAILLHGYSFLRRVEARLRMVTDRPLTELPESAGELEKLARHLGYERDRYRSAATRLTEELTRTTQQIRNLVSLIIQNEEAGSSSKPSDDAA